MFCVVGWLFALISVSGTAFSVQLEDDGDAKDSEIRKLRGRTICVIKYSGCPHSQTSAAEHESQYQDLWINCILDE
jgi:hypothetical protein